MPAIAWITGAGGLIGSHLVQGVLQAPTRWQAVGLGRADLEPDASDHLRDRFERERPALIVHCAALSRGAECERDPAFARRVNVELTARLAELARDIAFVFLSTDLVFDGLRGGYRESDPPRPLGVYAETKAAAEQIVLGNPRHLVVRTSLNLGHSPTADRAMNEVMRRDWQAGRTLRLFTDEFRCPIPARITARAIWELADHNQAGLLHLAGAERLSRWQIGQLIAARCPELQPRLEPASIREFQGPPRSPDTSLDCSRVRSLLSFPLPKFSQYLDEHPGDVV